MGVRGVVARGLQGVVLEGHVPPELQITAVPGQSWGGGGVRGSAAEQITLPLKAQRSHG